MNEDRFRFIDAAAVLDPGIVRKNNEDSILSHVKRGCFAIADGMGGGARGEVASKLVIAAIHQKILHCDQSPAMREYAVTQSAYGSNSYIASIIAREKLKSMGSTLVCLLFHPWDAGLATVFHAGDSRCYRFRDNSLSCLTKDHSVAGAAGRTDGRRTGLLTNAVGSAEKFFLDRAAVDVMADDLFLLCSDGLTAMLPDKEIEKSLRSRFVDLHEAIDELRRLALQKGGRDNISIILIRVRQLAELYLPTAEEIAADLEIMTLSRCEPDDTAVTLT